MKDLTPENMIDAIEWYVDVRDQTVMFDAFYRMHFHGFINNETWCAFCEAWKNKRLREQGK